MSTESAPSLAHPYDVFDHRTRDWRRRWRGQYVGFFASDPCNGRGERLPRVRTLLLPGWKIEVARTRRNNRTGATP